MSMQQKNYLPICVSGMGCVCAAGTDVKKLLHTKTTLSDAKKLHELSLPHPFFAAPDKAFGNNRKFSARDTLDLALFAVEQALVQAEIISDENYKSSCAVVMGTTAGSALHFLNGYKALREQIHTANISSSGLPQDIDNYFNSNLALSISQKYQTHGPALTIANACTSGADAIGLGMDMILQGQCSTVICGGADALSLVPHTGFARLMIYSKELCRPFDGNRQGLNLGEGAGVVILEKTEHALARGVKPLGYIAGYGTCADAHHFTAPHPEARGLHMAISHALKQANITSEELAFVNAHGTATKENDKVEGKFFKQHMGNIPIWGSKSITGHTLGAAGAVEAIFCLLALQQKNVPTTLGFESADPEINLVPTQQDTKLEKQYALSTSLGFGGSNAALVLKGADHE